MSDLPPLDDPLAYVVVGPNDLRGPYPLELLLGEVLAGRLHDATPVWWPGLDEWTTMGAQPGVAAELARRRAGYAPQPAVAPAPAPGQYQEAVDAGQGTWSTAAPGQPTEPVSGQNYSADMYAGESFPVEVATEPAPVQDEWPSVGVQDEAPTPGMTAPATVEPESTLVGEVAPVEVTGGEDADVPSAMPAAGSPFTSSAPAEAPVAAMSAGVAAASVAPHHQAAFDELVDRSRSLTAAADQIAASTAAINAAVIGAVESQGFTFAERVDGGDVDEIRFDGEPGETLQVNLGHLVGDDAAEVRSGDVAFGVRFQSSSASASATTAGTPSGGVVVTADEWTGQAVSSAALRLPLDRYLAEDLSVDTAALDRDVVATVAVVRSHLG